MTANNSQEHSGSKTNSHTNNFPLNNKNQTEILRCFLNHVIAMCF